MARRPQAVVFDIIETVFSLEAMRTPLAELGLPEGDLETWFAYGLRDAFALNTTGDATAFPAILAGALDQLCAVRGVDADAAGKRAVLAAMKTMQPHPGAAEAFERLGRAGVPIYALSNGAASATRGLLEGAGLIHPVREVLSVETVGAFKPSKAVYDQAIAAAGVPADRLMMIATHAWDTHGAKAAGMSAGFVGRGQVYPDTMRAPDVTGQDLVDTVGQALALPDDDA